jgi:small subunit ribosomal protein S9
MPEDPQTPDRPEGDSPEDEALEGVPGEPGETTPAEPEPDAGEDAAPDAGAPGPEIEGAEELAEAARPQAAGERPAEPEEARPEAAGEQPAEPEEAGAAAEAPEALDAPAEPPAAAEAPEEAPAAEAPAERPRPERRRRREDQAAEEVIPGAHLEPDLVLEEEAPQERDYGEYGEYAEAESEAAVEEAVPAEEAPAEPAPVAREPLDLAADARYHATGKRKSAVARVILKPGEGTYRINGRHLDEYFPRVLLQRMARQPLEAAGYHTRMDVVARIHGGGVSAQATALRHGVARALVEADPALRGELKRRGYLTRDPRVKERKKAGLKKARKRPQFSKR